MEVQRVLLADDHALFREGMAGLFAYEEDFEVVGEAADGEAAIAAARELMPDLVLMDIDMPRCDGIEATRRLKREMPYVNVVMLTVHEDDERLFEAIKAGAQGYLVKSIHSREMLELLRGMSRGEAPISRAMATRILEEFRRTTAATGPASAPRGRDTGGAGVPGAPSEPGTPGASAGSGGAMGVDELEAPEATLTAREQEVLELVAQRYTNKEIAVRLVISEHTVKNHLKNILSKLHLRSRTQAARYALGRGLVAPAAAAPPVAPGAGATDPAERR